MIRSSLVPRTRSSRTSCGKCDRELRVQRGTRIIELLVALGFRSSYPNVRRVLTNFGIGPLAAAVAAAFAAAIAPSAMAQEAPDQRLGTVHFETSCNDTAQRRFD